MVTVAQWLNVTREHFCEAKNANLIMDMTDVPSWHSW